MKDKLQKQSFKSKTEEKIKGLLSKGKFKEGDLKLFDDEEMTVLGEYFTKKLNELKGTEFDDFYDKIEAITPKDTKTQLWYKIHNSITWAISTFIHDNGRMPSPFEIANKTEMSSYLVNQHMKEYSKDSKYINSKEQFEFMTSKVLAKVFKFAVDGDMRAAKLYFEVVGNLKGENSNNPVINNQNNYIQINQLKLSQEAIEQLAPEQLKEVERLFQQVVLKVKD
ncbi:hypothetical protein [Segetibacter aerophilus]|uniref:Uncharacterized protein n=1 Tax=Segetibacter aerophilus TaxID=670293 RepID=A0A512BC27_9BACT|nr:hypothetical protein [Segetibacter aerophilus]GEO09492.1 hypothetical protein SAE01_19880 [Segetibacter aerophilus]